jgi:hypothetical protein
VIYKPRQDKTFLYQFIPKKYEYLLKVKKIEYKNINLKTDYLINIIHELILKYYFNKDDEVGGELSFNMWSTLLREKYGSKYNYYIKYLIENDFMIMVSDYYKNKKARTYKLNLHSLQNIKKCQVSDKVLLKKNTKEYLKVTFLNYTNSPIPIDIRGKLVDDLYKLNIDFDASMEYLNDLKDNRKIYYNKFFKNVISVENINSGNIFFKFDEYGRMHTNFTILKKEIRKKLITFDGLETDEVDISNSQPLFLILLMKEKMTTSELITPDVSKYIELVQNGLVYEELIDNCNIENRNEAKIMMYKVLFGKNGHSSKYNICFRRIFPTVYDFIKKYKEDSKDYKVLSHDLQLKESNFIYNKVVKHIMEVNPEIPLFTVHDSIVFPVKYKKIVKDIFNYYLRNLLNL